MRKLKNKADTKGLTRIKPNDWLLNKTSNLHYGYDFGYDDPIRKATFAITKNGILQIENNTKFNSKNIKELKMNRFRTCCDCGVKLTSEEIKYYICRCENCEKACHEEMLSYISQNEVIK
ncbi:MAG: hypothetical protein ACRC8F_04020 [Cetobacterium sp.]